MAASGITRMRKHPGALQSLILITLIFAFAVNLYGLLAGVTIVTPHLFYIPIILTAFFYPRRGVFFAIVLSAAYLLMVVTILPGDRINGISAGARCIVYIIVAAVVSFLSERVNIRERDLAKAKGEWERTFDAVPDLIALIDREHRILRVNRALGKCLGISPEQAIGLKCDDLISRSKIPPQFCSLGMLLKDGQEHSIEVHEDNTGRDFYLTSSPLYNDAGTLISSVNIAHDITARKQTEQALRESEKRYRDLFESNYAVMMLVDPETGRIVDANSAASRYYGYSKEEFFDIAITDINTADPKTTCQNMAVASSKGGKVFSFRHKKKNGEIRDVEIYSAPIVLDGRRLLHSIIQDVTERKRAEEALLEKTEELDQYFSTSLDLFCIADTQGYFRRLNAQWEKSLGYTLAELEGKRFLDFVHPDDMQATLDALSDLSAQKDVVNFTNRYRHRDGTYRWIEWRSFPKGDRIFAAARDITDRKRIENSLRESEEKYRSIIDEMQDIFYRTDPEGKISMLSPSAARLAGYDTIDQLLGKEVTSVYSDPAGRDRFLDAIRKNGSVYAYPLSLVTRDGTIHHVTTSSHFYRDASGNIMGVEGVIHDITEQWRGEEALRLQNQIFETIAEGVFLIRASDGVIVYANPKFEKMFGYEPGELPGKHASVINAPGESKDPQDIADEIMNTLNEKGEWSGEIKNIRKDGTTFWCLAVVSTFKHPEFGSVWISAHTDITQLKRVEEERKNEEQRNSMRLEILVHLAEMESADKQELANFVLDAGCRITDSPFAFIGTMTPDESAMDITAWSKSAMSECSVATSPIHYPIKKAGIWAEAVRKRKPVVVNDYTAPLPKKLGLPAGHVPVTRFISVPIFEGPRIVMVFAAANKETEYSAIDVDNLTLLMQGVWNHLRKRSADEALRESEADYRAIIENIQDVFFRADKDDRIVMLSPSAAPTFGHTSAAEMLGIPVRSLWKRPEQRAEFLDTIKKQGGALQDWESEFVKADGTAFWVSISAHLRMTDRGQYLETEGIIRDISERKKMEEALKSALTKLNMLSSITRHDILNQIMGLRTFLELSREDLKGTRFAEFIEKEDQAAETIQRQIEFTKFYQDIGVNAPKWQDVAAVIHSAVAQLNPEAIEVKVTITGVEIFADPLIEKVFYNLMENSLRHGERVTTMEFSSRESDAGLVITYCDNGVGIPLTDKQKLFQKGFGKHTGLGLFLSREILAITGITITENGEPGVGVRFEITVPNDAYRYTS